MCSVIIVQRSLAAERLVNVCKIKFTFAEQFFLLLLGEKYNGANDKIRWRFVASEKKQFVFVKCWGESEKKSQKRLAANTLSYFIVVLQPKIYVVAPTFTKE